MARELATELKEWMLCTEGQLIFPGPDGGSLSNNMLNRWYRELCREAGVHEVSSHGARRTSGPSYAVAGAVRR